MSFKSAAIKVLKDANGPLHVRKITKRAQERGLIETSGATPKQTMSTEMRQDIRKNGNNSAFILIGKNYFSYNPSHKQMSHSSDPEKKWRRARHPRRN